MRRTKSLLIVGSIVALGLLYRHVAATATGGASTGDTGEAGA